VGDDAISKQWLTVHLQDLVRLHAQGILVNSKSKEAVAAMRSTFSTLSLLTVSANMIADNLHLNHYPVLITRHEVLA
jgi:integrating conjugative element protein (TIGR03765 family)